MNAPTASPLASYSAYPTVCSGPATKTVPSSALAQAASVEDTSTSPADRQVEAVLIEGGCSTKYVYSKSASTPPVQPVCRSSKMRQRPSGNDVARMVTESPFSPLTQIGKTCAFPVGAVHRQRDVIGALGEDVQVVPAAETRRQEFRVLQPVIRGRFRSRTRWRIGRPGPRYAQLESPKPEQKPAHAGPAHVALSTKSFRSEVQRGWWRPQWSICLVPGATTPRIAKGAEPCHLHGVGFQAVHPLVIGGPQRPCTGDADGIQICKARHRVAHQVPTCPIAVRLLGQFNIRPPPRRTPSARKWFTDRPPI